MERTCFWCKQIGEGVVGDSTNISNKSYPNNQQLNGQKQLILERYIFTKKINLCEKCARAHDNNLCRACNNPLHGAISYRGLCRGCLDRLLRKEEIELDQALKPIVKNVESKVISRGNRQDNNSITSQIIAQHSTQISDSLEAVDLLKMQNQGDLDTEQKDYFLYDIPNAALFMDDQALKLIQGDTTYLDLLQEDYGIFREENGWSKEILRKQLENPDNLIEFLTKHKNKLIVQVDAQLEEQLDILKLKQFDVVYIPVYNQLHKANYEDIVGDIGLVFK